MTRRHHEFTFEEIGIHAGVHPRDNAEPVGFLGLIPLSYYLELHKTKSFDCLLSPEDCAELTAMYERGEFGEYSSSS